MSRVRAWLAAAAGLAAAACVHPADEMADQARYEAYEPSRHFADGASARHLAEGVVVRVASHDAAVPRVDEAMRARALDPDRPPVVDRAVLERGESRFAIWCSPCHGRAGEGDGLVVAHGYPRAPSLVEPRLRDASDEHLYRVITHGLGKMPPYGPHVAPPDRWAIVAFVRALQRSRHATLADVPQARRAELEAAPPEPAEPTEPTDPTEHEQR